MEIRTITSKERRSLMELYRYAYTKWSDHPVKDEELDEIVVDETLGLFDDGRLLSFATAPRNFGVFDLEKRRLLFVSPDLSNGIWQMRWNQDATRLGMIEGNGRARILNITAIRSQLGELGLDW